jgi:flagellin
MLQRFKELATQGMNGALSSDQRAYLSVEMGNLAKEIVAISDRTTFNNNKLLSSTGALTFQTGPELNTTTGIGIVEINKVNLQSVGESEEFTKLYTNILAEGEINDTYFNDDGTGKINATSQFSSYSAYADAALTEVATLRAKFGTTVTRLNHNIANLTALHENLSAANSRVVDTDYAAETANLTKTQILQQAATAMLSQANAQPNVVLALLK